MVSPVTFSGEAFLLGHDNDKLDDHNKLPWEDDGHFRNGLMPHQKIPNDQVQPYRGALAASQDVFQKSDDELMIAFYQDADQPKETKAVIYVTGRLDINKSFVKRAQESISDFVKRIAEKAVVIDFEAND